MSRHAGRRVTETESPTTPRRNIDPNQVSRGESAAASSTPSSATFSSPPTTPRGNAFTNRASASPISQPHTPKRDIESSTSYGGGVSAIRRPLHTPPVLLPSLRDSIGNRHYTPSPPRSPALVQHQQQQQIAVGSTPSPSPRRRPQAIYDAAGTVDLAAAAAAIGTTASSPSTSRSPVSVPLQQTRSTDSATTTSSASATSSASDAENENSWPSSWIDHELEFGDDSLAKTLNMGSHASSHVDEKTGVDAVASSPFRVGRTFATVGGVSHGFPDRVGGQNDSDEPELLTDLTPMPAGPSAASTELARISPPLPALPTTAPLFSSVVSTEQLPRPASPDALPLDRAAARLNSDEKDRSSRPLSEFDWIAAYEEAPRSDNDFEPRSTDTAGQTAVRPQDGDKPPATLNHLASENGRDTGIPSSVEAPALDPAEAPPTADSGPIAQPANDELSLLRDSLPRLNPPPRPLSWVERPASRASVRSTGSTVSLVPGAAAPPRPPRRQPSNASLASVRSSIPPTAPSPNISATDAIHKAEASTKEPAAADSPRPESVATSSSYATADASPSVPSPSQPNRHSRTFSNDMSALSYRAPLTPSPARKERGPAPVVPVKSARRASLQIRQRSSEPPKMMQLPATVPPVPAAGGSGFEATDVREDSPPAEVEPSSLPPAESAGQPLRDSAVYDLADIADIYARNSLYYPPPDETPRASRALQQPVDATALGGSLKDGPGEPSGNADREASAAALFAATGLPPNASPSPPKPTPLAIPFASRSSEESPRTAREDARARAAAFIDDLKREKAAEAASLAHGSVDPASSALAFTSTCKVVSRESTPPPPPPPPSSTKRPSEDLSIYSDVSRRPSYDIQNRSTSNVVGSRRPSETTLPTSAAISGDLRSFASQVPLFRRRPLPTAVIIASELRSASNTRERCRIYEQKLNELGRVRSRLDEWILAVGDGHRSIQPSPNMLPHSPARSRRGRQESSASTFPPRGDGYRATEISRGTFSSQDVVPIAPYPGVVGPTRSTSHASLGSGLGSASSGAGGKSFFSGLGRGSLGRRMSKRDSRGGPASRSPAKSSSGSAKSSIRSTISGPVQILSSTNTALAPVSDEVYSRTSPHGGHRASFDSRVSSPSQSPKASRNSFAYGSSTGLPPSSASIPTFQVTRGSIYHDNGEKDIPSQVADLDEEKLSRLADILPQATRADLAAALEDAGGDDVLAISVYLSAH